MKKKELLAPCGLYCGVCGVFIAHRDHNEKFKERLSTVYGCSPEDIVCEGCLSENTFKYCRVCPIKTCTGQKNYQGCHQCGDFPCTIIENFPLPVGKKVILRAIPTWRELGTEIWVEQEELRYHCPHCGFELFRGAKRCRECKDPVDLD
ncbi:MAG: DUF3795 domain-containing protein [Desulfomonile tiedjei]|uniref:DUF3795 domain-containing protein n=1 Tax=Desulfomonile tiedjei TaxID=2358 RepID=A0A9D6Z0N6_9BACT|nr:DUF3795 domain-containing protein [Desulfomonile tiedjei]